MYSVLQETKEYVETRNIKTTRTDRTEVRTLFNTGMAGFCLYIFILSLYLCQFVQGRSYS